MAQVKSESELLRSSDVSAFSRWDLPSFDEAPHQVALEREPPEPQEPEIEDEPEIEVEEVKPFTVEELEQIRQEAYNEGFSTGEKDGFHAGQLKGQQEARNALEARLGEFEQLMGQLMAPLQQQEQQRLFRGWIEQGLHPLQVAAHLLQATHQQPLAQAHSLLRALGLRRSLQADVASALRQGFDGVLQALGVDVLEQAGRRQLQQLLPRQA